MPPSDKDAPSAPQQFFNPEMEPVKQMNFVLELIMEMDKKYREEYAITTNTKYQSFLRSFAKEVLEADIGIYEPHKKGVNYVDLLLKCINEWLEQNKNTKNIIIKQHQLLPSHHNCNSNRGAEFYAAVISYRDYLNSFSYQIPEHVSSLEI